MISSLRLSILKLGRIDHLRHLRSHQGKAADSVQRSRDHHLGFIRCEVLWLLPEALHLADEAFKVGVDLGA